MVDHNTDFFQIIDNFAKTAHIPSLPIIESKLNFEPKVTIAIPTYKRPELLKEAIDSALNQTDYSNYEIIVVDNNPERNCETEQRLRNYSNPRISYYKNTENLGMYENWNRCIELSRGKYVTILNDDDTLNENYLKSVNGIISRPNKPIDALVVGFQVIDSNGNVTSPNKDSSSKISRIIALDLLFGNINPGSLGIIFSRKTLINIGGYDETYYPSSDYMFLVKYLVNFDNVFYFDKILANYRIAVNESKKLTTLQGFIDIDRKIRATFLIIYPKLKKLIELSFPFIELNQYKALSEVSSDFYNVNSSQIALLRNQVNSKNKIAFKALVFLKKILRRKINSLKSL